MSDRWKAIWLERTDLVRVYLRSSTLSKESECSGTKCGHYAYRAIVAEASVDIWHEIVDEEGGYAIRDWLISKRDSRWPNKCERCGADISDNARRSVTTTRLYRAPDDQLYTLEEAPIGSMWDADSLHCHDGYVGPDGISLHVKTPGGDWCVDSQASNCDMNQCVNAGDPERPNAYRFVRSHYCWVRHGDPRTGNIHVDKNGNTCGAGAGSIQAGSWHGYLHNGYLSVDG